MRANITFDVDGYAINFAQASDGEYELPLTVVIDFLRFYHLVNNELVLDEEKKASAVEEEEKQIEINDLQNKLNGTDYIIARTFEEIMALDNPLTFIADFIKILKNFKSKYAEQLENRKTWRERIEELKNA